MEFINDKVSNAVATRLPRYNRLTLMPALAQDTTMPNVRQALVKLGDAVDFFGFMIPANIGYIVANQENAMRKGKTRSLAIIIRAYGEAAVVNNLTAFVAKVASATGETWDEQEMRELANTIADTKEARTLDYISVVGFFKWLIEGHAKLYKGKLINAMNAFQDYVPIARRNEEIIRDTLERERQAKEEAARKPTLNGASLQEFLSRNFPKLYNQ